MTMVAKSEAERAQARETLSEVIRKLEEALRLQERRTAEGCKDE